MPENLENSVVATGLKKVNFHSNPKERQCQRMFELPHNCTHLTHQESNTQNSPSELSTVSETKISKCCFLTCIQISEEVGQVVWYSHLFQNFPQFIVIHTVEGFCVVNNAEIDVFLELSCFFDDPGDVGNLISGSSAFSKTSLNIQKFLFRLLLKARLENFEHYFPSV